MNTTYMSTAATLEALIELFPPEALVAYSCLKMQLLYVMMRDVLRFCGITVEQRQGLYIPQAILNAVYAEDATLKNTANTYLADFKLAPQRSSSGAGASSDTRAGAGDNGTDNESDWRKIDAANRRFNESEKYSGILAQSPNLTEARNAYMTYCSQKVSLVLTVSSWSLASSRAPL